MLASGTSRPQWSFMFLCVSSASTAWWSFWEESWLNHLSKTKRLIACRWLTLDTWGPLIWCFFPESSFWKFLDLMTLAVDENMFFWPSFGSLANLDHHSLENKILSFDYILTLLLRCIISCMSGIGSISTIVDPAPFLVDLLRFCLYMTLCDRLAALLELCRSIAALTSENRRWANCDSVGGASSNAFFGDIGWPTDIGMLTTTWGLPDMMFGDAIACFRKLPGLAQWIIKPLSCAWLFWLLKWLFLLKIYCFYMNLGYFGLKISWKFGRSAWKLDVFACQFGYFACNLNINA